MKKYFKLKKTLQQIELYTKKNFVTPKHNDKPPFFNMYPYRPSKRFLKKLKKDAKKIQIHEL